MAKSSSGFSFKPGKVSDLYSPKFLLVYVAFFIALYLMVNSFAALEEADGLLYDVSPSLATKIAGVRWATTMRAQNGSTQDGRVTLLGVKNQTKVIVSVSNEAVAAVEPAHIHVGSCPNPGAVVYPLTNVVKGSSVTMLPVKLSDMMKQVPLAVNVHTSAAEIGTYVSCGDLK